MSTTISRAFTLFLATLTGCQAAAAGGAPAVARIEPLPATSSTVAAPARGEVAFAAALPALALTVAAAPASEAPPQLAAPAACDAAPAALGFYGFYASDAWAQGNVVLTFDDGPIASATPRVLDQLAARGMQATFFLVGRNISRTTYPLVQRMVAAGHTLGSHSYSHDVHMTHVGAPKETIEIIRSQHEATAILIDIALLARSGDDFDAMVRRVFDTDPARWMSPSTIRKGWRAALARHRTMLEERGLPPGQRPYDVLYSRPPGGGPYVEHDGAAGVALHDAALKELGMVNVLWHGASGDTIPGQRRDRASLTANMNRQARRGGVLLIHDHIRGDALAASLREIDADPALQVMSLDQAVQRKYACAAGGLRAKLGRGAARAASLQVLLGDPTPAPARPEPALAAVAALAR
ncbi:MAG: polysaccharide deacetylase family protein [Polyangiaceae bacterium]